MRRYVLPLAMLGLTAGCGVSGTATGVHSKPASGTSSTTTSVTAATTTTASLCSDVPGGQPGDYGGTQPVCVAIVPDHGPIGTTVHVSGAGFTGMAGQLVRTHAYFFSLISASVVPNCELISASLDPEVSVDAAGHLAGSFRVAATGYCFQEGSTHPLRPDTYQVVLGPHPAFIGGFRVTS